MFGGSCASDYKNNTILRLLNDLKAIEFYPVIVVLCGLMIIGIIGNLLVCYIYHFRFKRTSANIFIEWLAILDIVSCVIGVPFEILDLLEPYNFHHPYACKIMRFTSSATVIASGLTLVAVAFDRYYKIAQPLRSFPNRTAKILNICSLILGLIVATPNFFIFGCKKLSVPYIGKNFTGYECSVDDDMIGTPYPFAHYAILAAVFLICIASFIVLYGRLGYVIFTRKNSIIGQAVEDRESCYRDSMSSEVIKQHLMDDSSKENKTSGPHHQKLSPNCDVYDNGIAKHAVRIRRLSVDSPRENNQFNFDTVDNKNRVQRASLPDIPNLLMKNTTAKPERLDVKRTKVNLRQHSRTGTISIRTGRVTCIFVCVSVVFVASFLPYVVVKILSLFYRNMSLIAYNFATRSFFINSAANPIIYSFLNERFRHECKLLFRKITCRE